MYCFKDGSFDNGFVDIPEHQYVLRIVCVPFLFLYAVERGLLLQATKDSFDSLYNLRNNIHILKAADSQYIPKLREAKEAFILMQAFVDEIKAYYKANSNN